jgi:hypothetical protein
MSSGPTGDMEHRRYAVISGAFSPALARIRAANELADTKLRAVAGDQYERLLEVVSIRWNRSYGMSINSGRPLPSRAEIVDGVISDWARGHALRDEFDKSLRAATAPFGNDA